MSRTLVMFDGLDGYDSYTALQAGGKWGTATSFLTPTTGRHGGADTAMRFVNGANLVATKSLGNTCRICFGLVLRSGGSGTVLSLYNNVGARVFAMLRNSTLQNLLFYKGDGSAGTLLGNTNDNLGLDTWHWVEVLYGAGTDLKVYVDGVLEFQASATPGTGTITGVGFGGTSDGSTFDLDDVAIMTETDMSMGVFGDSRVKTFFPTSDEVLEAGWVPNAGSTAYEVVDDTAPASDNDYIICSTAGDYAVVGSSGTLDFTPATIHAVGVSMRAKKDASGDHDIKGVVRVSGTIYDGGQSFALAEGIQAYQEIFLVNPDTTLAWTKAGVEGAGFGIKLET